MGPSVTVKMHYRNDGIFHAIKHWTGISATSFARNTHVTTSMGTNRPDFTMFIYQGVPIIIAEEKEIFDLC